MKLYTIRGFVALAVLSIAVVLIGFYLLVNVGLIMFVPLGYDVTVGVTVLENSSEIPIQGANISWLTGSQLTTPFGLTDAAGRSENTLKVQQQPIWVYPRIGWHRFTNQKLRIAKNGYETETIRLFDFAPSVPLSQERVSITVRMKKNKDQQGEKQENKQ